MATIQHSQGDMEKLTSLEQIPPLLDELLTADQEHGDVSIADASGWTLSAHRDGSLVWGDTECDDEFPQHLPNQPREVVLDLFSAVARGDLDRVHSQPWLAGYPTAGGGEPD